MTYNELVSDFELSEFGKVMFPSFLNELIKKIDTYNQARVTCVTKEDCNYIYKNGYIEVSIDEYTLFIILTFEQ